MGVDLLPGERFDVPTRDGRTLAAVSAGEGRPTVVLEAGAGASAASWQAAWTGLAERTRVVAYDRAGLGCSPVDPQPRTLRRMADDLEDLLLGCGPGPFVLVGHSLGGPLARVAAAELPDLVSGLVLCDPAQEDADLYYRRGYALMTRATAGLVPLARLGLTKPLVGRVLTVELAGTPMPPAVVAALRQEMASARAARGLARELRHLVAGFRELRGEGARPVGVPVTVISGGVTRPREARVRSELVACHAALASRSQGGRHVTAERSGHLVPQQQPDLVVAEVLRLLALDPSTS